MRDAKGRRRVVVTGMGAVTAVGIGVEATWREVVAGTSGAGEITLVDHAAFPVHFAHEVKGFNPEEWLDPKEAKRNDRFVHFAMAVAKMAMEDSAFDIAKADPWRCGVVVGSGIGGIMSMEEQFKRFTAKGPSRISPFMIPLLMINAASGNIAIRYGFKGVNYGAVSACASANHAIGLALRHIQWGEADAVLTGGSEAGISILGLGGFSNMKALSTRNDSPQTACRPFDKERDGFVMGEGAGVVLLEALETATARGARIYGEVLGYGATDDAYHITAPEETGEGGVQAMRLSLEDAGIRPEEVDYINAHGTSTSYNDRVESLAIHKVFGAAARKLSVSSTKGQTGHCLGAAGGVEAVLTLMALKEGVVPPTINHQTPDPECDIDVTPNVAKKRELRYALSNSLGFGGHNCTLAFGRYPR